jgi:DNA-binding LytR/AlgR family response regulator
MIRALIIEDEENASKRLKKLIAEISAEIDIIDILDSVSSSKTWFAKNEAPDLLFLDIQLGDGLSFEIFDDFKTETYVIFTTAFDEYAIKAFELNSIDYLLKPIHKDKLKRSIEKFFALRSSTPKVDFKELLSVMENKTSAYKKRFVINAGSRLISVEVENVYCFYSSNKDSYLIVSDNKTYPVDFSLDKLESILDPDKFFRINRQTIVSYNSINRIHILSKSRIKLETKFTLEQELLVSSGKSSLFREWLDK